MPKYYNNNPEFGMSGPFEAESKEQLSDEMQKTFECWAHQMEEWDDGTSKSTIIEHIIISFIAGLEEVK